MLQLMAPQQGGGDTITLAHPEGLYMQIHRKIRRERNPPGEFVEWIEDAALHTPLPHVLTCKRPGPARIIPRSTWRPGINERNVWQTNVVPRRLPRKARPSTVLVKEAPFPGTAKEEPGVSSLADDVPERMSVLMGGSISWSEGWRLESLLASLAGWGITSGKPHSAVESSQESNLQPSGEELLSYPPPTRTYLRA